MRSKPTLSATNLASAHHLGCDLYLHNAYHASEIPRNRLTLPSELSKAQFARGNDWESTLFRWLDEEDLLLTVHSSALDAGELFEILQFDERDHFFVAGLSFWPPKDALAAEYSKAGTQAVTFGLAKPDLVEITRKDGTITWQVIDAKASQAMKTSHLVQIYFYTTCLSLMLHDPFHSLGKAAVWLPPPRGFLSYPPSQEQLRTVDLHLISDSLNAFLFHRLPKILELARDDVRWHFNPLCRTCPFKPECRTRAIREKTLGSMPNITLDQAQVLDGLLVISRGKENESRPRRITDIEDLHRLFADNTKLNVLERAFPSTFRKSKRILGIPNRNNGRHTSSSAIVEAARTNMIKVINRRNFTCPRSEDVAVVLSLVQDPASNEIASFTLSVFTAVPALRSTEPVLGEGNDLIPTLASLIQTILDLRSHYDPIPRTQFYVFSSTEHALLQRHFVETALTLEPLDTALQTSVRLCIGALSEGASLLSTAFQPVILSGALLDFLGKKGARKKAELQTCLERLGLSREGTVEQLRLRVTEEIERLKREGGRVNAGSSRMELGQLPRIVVVAREVERLLALPVPGYWDLPECASLLLSHDPQCPSDEDIFLDYKEGRGVQVKFALQKRNWCIHEVIQNLRVRVGSAVTGRPELLVNEARILSAEFMDICKQEHLRKLFFMQQFEVLAKLTELWRSRIDGCPDAVILEYQASKARRTTTSASVEHQFCLISGALDTPNDKDRAFFDYLLVEDYDSTVAGNDPCNVPVESMFNDIGVAGLVFPLNKYTRSKWDEQHVVVQNNLLVADIRDIDIQDCKTLVVLQTWSSFSMKFIQGHHYRLSPRLVDFNLSKILSTLLELDLRIDGDAAAIPKDPFLQLITRPRSLASDAEGSSHTSKAILKEEAAIQRLFRELYDLGSAAAGTLILKSSQHRAAQRFLSERLTVIWGPPGTGKTYTIALSLIRLFNIQARLQSSDEKIVFLTAMTHAAIDACLTKLSQLTDNYRKIPDLPTAWLDKIRIEHVVKGNDHAPPTPGFHYIYAGTVYQLYNFSKRRSLEVDCVVVDEAGQLSLGSAALVLRSLLPNGKILIAGDSLQLAPILIAHYPRLKSRLFGSILDCLMDLSGRARDEDNVTSESLTRSSSISGFSEVSSSSQISTIVQLTENFRLNPDLSEFVSTIYSRAFKPQKVQARQVASKLKSLDIDVESDEITQEVQHFLLALSDVMLRRPQTLLQPPRLDNTVNKTGTQVVDLSSVLPHHPISLALIRLETVTSRPEQVGYEVHVRGEAAIAAALVKSLRKCFPTEDIFVATPHRIQRQAVKAALDSGEVDSLVHAMADMDITVPAGKVVIDTVERLQGSEAAFVICLFSLPQNSGSVSQTELGFLLERRRLNVAISRAKILCILVTSDNVLQPSIRVLSDEGSAKGYAFLRTFEERAWSTSLKIDLDHL